MMAARTAVRRVGYGLWKAHRVVPECTMIDWDDVRYFLAVARGGSVRAAAERLGVNHATVLRRIAQLEERLGVHMFEKLPSGYRLTAAGEEVLEFADQMEASSHLLETRVFGRDQSVRGLLRVTLAPPLATHLAHAGLGRFRASASGHRDGNLVVRRAGKSDQPRGRCRDPRRLRPQNPAAQPSRPEGTGAVRRRLHISRSTSRVACGRA